MIAIDRKTDETQGYNFCRECMYWDETMEEGSPCCGCSKELIVLSNFRLREDANNED